MGFTFVKVRVLPAAATGEGIEREFLVDTGAIYSMLPAEDLQALGIQPSFQRTFTLADGRSATYPVGAARFKVNGSEGIAEIIFGEKGTQPLLGVVVLESMGLQVDPVSKQLKPMPLYLMRV